MQSTLNDFTEFLSRQGLRLTSDRREVLQAVSDTDGHFNIDDLYVRMRTHGSQIAKTTIYRTIPLLIDCHIIQRVPSANTKHEYYEQVQRRQHDHLVCLKCGRMVEFSSKKFEQAQAEVCKAQGFEPLFHRVHIVGYCRECRAQV